MKELGQAGPARFCSPPCTFPEQDPLTLFLQRGSGHPTAAQLAGLQLVLPVPASSAARRSGGGKIQLLSCHSIFQEALQRSRAFPCHPAPAKLLRDKGKSQGLSAPLALGEAAGVESWERSGESCRGRPRGDGMPGHASCLSVNSLRGLFSIGTSDLVLQHSKK